MSKYRWLMVIFLAITLMTSACSGGQKIPAPTKPPDQSQPTPACQAHRSAQTFHPAHRPRRQPGYAQPRHRHAQRSLGHL